MKKDSAVFHQKAGDIQKKRNAGICTLYSRAVLWHRDDRTLDSHVLSVFLGPILSKSCSFWFKTYDVGNLGVNASFTQLATLLIN